MLWQEYYDDQSASFYYFNPVSGKTQWMIDFAKLPDTPGSWRAPSSAAEYASGDYAEEREECTQGHPATDAPEAQESKVNLALLSEWLLFKWY